MENKPPAKTFTDRHAPRQARRCQNTAHNTYTDVYETH